MGGVGKMTRVSIVFISLALLLLPQPVSGELTGERQRERERAMPSQPHR